MTYLYRVNWGNGQVHQASSLAYCKRIAALYGDGFTYIEFQDETGDWFPYRMEREQ